MTTPTVVPPYSPNLDVWTSNPSRVLITIVNLSAKSYDIRLAGSARNGDGSLTMETKNDVGVPPIHINPHESKQLNLNDFRIFDPNVVRFKGTNTAIIARTHLLPDGVYSLCVHAIEYKTLIQLSPDQCATFEIRNADAPMLISPANRSELDPDKFPLLQFQWIPPVQAPPTAVYQFSLLELPQKMEAEAGFRMPAVKQVFTREVRGANMLSLRSAELQLESGHIYAWRVRITDPMNTMSFHNDGYSEAWSFTYGNIGIIKPKAIMPDTLIDGSFTIVVESWDTKSKSDDPKLPSGTGCVKFDCSKTKKLIPPYWEGLGLQSKSFNVIDSKVQDSLTQMHVMDAKLIDNNVKVGDKLSLDLPSGSISKASQISDVAKYLGWLKGKLPAGCILVQFHDVTWTLPTKKTVVLTGGSAYYPTTPPTPPPPAMLVLDSGFTLAIDSLVISPTEATVQGKLLLPKNIISADTCTRAFLKLPKTTITSNCEFYKEVIVQDSDYGKWWLGETGLLIHGSQYIIDFSSSQSPSGFSPPLASSWKGVVLRQGETSSNPSMTMISNRGYVKAPYRYQNAKINSDGFEGSLRMYGGSWKFTTLEPYGYLVELNRGDLSLAASSITGGGFQEGTIAAPQIAIRDQAGGTLIVEYSGLTVQNDMDLYGTVRYDQGFRWGEYSKTTGQPRFYLISAPGSTPNPDSGGFYLGAAWRKPYYPADSNWHEPILAPISSALEVQGIQGITFPKLTKRDFVIFTPDVPTPSKYIQFKKEVFAGMWMNFIRSGLHGEVLIVCDSTQEKDYQLGDSLRVKYDGKTSFKTDFGLCPPGKRTDVTGANLSAVSNRKVDVMPFQFCESAVWNSELAGEVRLPVPASINVRFKNMMFTSTADCAGGQVDLSKPDSMPYWGVKLVAKDTGKSAGIVCARLGVIYLTAAGIAEPRHYSKPFWLTGGELKADGNLGKMFFDYNSVGQRFDGFPFSPSFVKLSDYKAVNTETATIPGMSSPVGILSGFLHAYGSLSVHFFGSKYVSLSDYKLDSASNPFAGGGYPYMDRWIRLQTASVLSTPASDVHWQRTWAAGIAKFDYTSIVYDSLIQDGFLGSGTASVLEISGGMSSTITIKAERSCFSIIAEASHQLNLAVVANFSDMEKIWGCGCIVGDNLEKVVIGAEVSVGGGVGSSLAARAGGMLSIKLSFLPTQTRLQLQGDMYALIASSINAEVTGSAEFVEDWGAGYVEGDLQGKIQFSTFLSGIDAEGELQWHFGLDYEMIQGKVAIGMYGPATFGLQSGVFLGVNCPASKIWVTDDIDGRFSLNKNALPTDSHGNLSGMYAYLSVETSINLYIVSGGYQVYAGMGAFFSGGGFGVVGNVGVRIWGEILGGLVSASAWGNLQLLVGIPPAFQGSIGLEACVLWVFCGSVTVNCGYNHVDGFYLN
ncbi:MAG: hypothetical protein Q8919_08075 [Bacteroidota bacterium]|nr:hypothetical protein [Bacteroidota bacterium]